MKRWNCSWPLLLAAALDAVHARPAGAQNQEPLSATNAVALSALVAEAFAKNPELRFYEAEIAAAKAGRRTAALFAPPELHGSVGHQSKRERDLNAEGVAWAVSVVQPFEWPGRIGLRKAIANRDVALAELGYERFKAALTTRLRTLAYGLLAAREKAAVAREVAERFQALREVLVQRDPAGLTPLLETRVIEATALNAQRKATDADLSAQAALFEMNQLQGRAPDAPLLVEPAQLSFRPADKTETLVERARTNNFELRVRELELAQQGFRVELARNERFPSLSIGPSVSEERAGGRERIIGVGLSLPLPLWSRNQGNIDTAAARQTQAEVSLQASVREVHRKVVAAAFTYETKLREMSRWRPDSVQHFREAAEVADRHYRLGAVPISTYVELQKQYLEAVEGLLETRAEALEAAGQLELLAGLTQPLVHPQRQGGEK